MAGLNLYEMMSSIAARGLAKQKRREKDYIGPEGMLICGVCGEPRQQIMLFPNPTAENPHQESPLKVALECRCDRERAAEENRREKAEKEAERGREIVSLLQYLELDDKELKEASFSRLDIDKYNEQNIKLCRRFANDFDDMVEKGQGLLFWGDVGTGKSYAAACIANELKSRGVPVIFTSFVNILDAIGIGGDEGSKIISRLNRVKLVVFDDLGAERSTDYALEKVYGIVDSRKGKQLPTIYTTNLTLKEMTSETDKRYKRIYDRILKNCFPMQFTGPSRRMKEAGRRFEEMRKFLEG